MTSKYNFLYAFLILALGCKEQTETSTTAVLDTESYTLAYPADLKLDETGANGTAFLLFTEKMDVKDNFVENINLMIQESDTLGLEDIVLATEREVKEAGKLISSKKVKNSNVDYQALLFEANMNGYDLKFNQHIYVHNKKAYVLTFTAEQDQYAQYAPEMEKVLEGFTIK